MIDKFGYLLALAREKHFGRAAEICGITQPTLSAGIKQLEDTLGVLLVNRGSRFIGLTAEGERVLDWARRIVGDVRTMREEIHAIQHGQLAGHLRIAVVPTALAMVPELTTPYRVRYPNVRFTVLSMTSIQILRALENLEIDAGITYLDNEPLEHVRSIPLYRESYCLVTDASSHLGSRAQVTWAEVGRIPLCLLTPDMQNRRIIDQLLRAGGADIAPPTLESDSMMLLFAHIRTRQWAGVMPANLVQTLGLSHVIRAIPIVEPTCVYTVGLVVPEREVMTPLAAALVTEALRTIGTFDTRF